MRDVLSWSFPMGQLFGIAIRVHFMLPLVMIGLIGREYVRDAPAGAWQDAAMLMGLMFLSVLLHEFGHCFAARANDGEADEILMWPLGGLAFCRSLPNTPMAHFIVALGGPLVNLVIFTIAGGVIYFVFQYWPPLNPFEWPRRIGEGSIAIVLSRVEGGIGHADNIWLIVLARTFWVNWFLFLFNVLLVGHPFDGGRMLQAALWPRFGQYQSSKIAVYAGFVCMIVIGLYAIIFIFIACSQELMMLESTHEESLFGYDFSQGYTSLEKDEVPAPPKQKKQNFIQRWLAKRAAQKQQREQEEREAEDKRMDDLLAKIAKFGKASLTDEEQRFLKRVADRYKNKP